MEFLSVEVLMEVLQGPHDGQYWPDDAIISLGPVKRLKCSRLLLAAVHSHIDKAVTDSNINLVLNPRWDLTPRLTG